MENGVETKHTWIKKTKHMYVYCFSAIYIDTIYFT